MRKHSEDFANAKSNLNNPFFVKNDHITKEGSRVSMNDSNLELKYQIHSALVMI
jgi:hypothetical protein